MSRRGNPLLRPVRQARNLAYKGARSAGNWIPAMELALAVLSGDLPEASYRFRAVLRRYVNRWIGGLVGKNLYGRGSFARMLKALLGL